MVTITHPFHPLRGQRVEIIRIIHRGADPDIIVRQSDGTHRAVAMSCTDYAGPSDTAPPPSPLPLLDISGLRQAARLIDHICQKTESAVAHRQSKSCTVSGESYD
jgi:hypothetical protein